jgi:hypothetical protein
VTLFPLRPLVSLETRTTLGTVERGVFRAQTHWPIGRLQAGHIVPLSVE